MNMRNHNCVFCSYKCYEPVTNTSVNTDKSTEFHGLKTKARNYNIIFKRLNILFSVRFLASTLAFKQPIKRPTGTLQEMRYVVNSIKELSAI